MKIAYLGPAGTYSEEAALAYGGHEAMYSAVSSTDEAVEQAVSGVVDVAVLAVENSTEGAVGRTLDLLVYTLRDERD